MVFYFFMFVLFKVCIVFPFPVLYDKRLLKLLINLVFQNKKNLFRVCASFGEFLVV